MSTTSTAASGTETPALPAPAGQEPNFVNPESLSHWAVVCATVCISVTTFLFALRMYVRIHIKKSWIIEDYMCSLSWAGFAVYCAIIITGMFNKAGFHEWDLGADEVQRAVYWLNAGSVAYGPVICCTKISILLLYRRIFFPVRRSRADLAICGFMLILVLFYFAITVVKIWECTPREKIWTQSLAGTCINVSVLFNVSGSFNSVTDVMILVIPWSAIWRLHVKRVQKILVSAVFAVGMIAPAFSIVGFVARFRVSASPDVSYNQAIISYWAAAEITTGIVCMCLPELAALVPEKYRRCFSKPGVVQYAINPNGQHHGRPARKKEFSTHDDEADLFDGAYLELERTSVVADQNQDHVDAITASTPVFTSKALGSPSTCHVEICGGKNETTSEKEGPAVIAGDENAGNGLEILKTVTIEQSSE